MVCNTQNNTLWAFVFSKSCIMSLKSTVLVISLNNTIDNDFRVRHNLQDHFTMFRHFPAKTLFLLLLASSLEVHNRCGISHKRQKNVTIYLLRPR